MQFAPYYQGDAAHAMKMLVDHIDFTPESVLSDNNHNNADYFKEAYVDEKRYDSCYVLKADDGTAVKGFMEVEKRCFKGDNECWYIKSLFIANDHDVDDNAIYMVGQFFSLMQDTDTLCANVHPQATNAIAFWLGNGFAPDPDRSIFSNADEQVLTAYCKKK